MEIEKDAGHRRQEKAEKLVEAAAANMWLDYCAAEKLPSCTFLRISAGTVNGWRSLTGNLKSRFAGFLTSTSC